MKKAITAEMRKAIETMYIGKSKREAYAMAKEAGHEIRFYWASSHDIPQLLSLRTAEGAMVDLWFEKSTRRIGRVDVRGCIVVGGRIG
jgi:hypothetical protein